MMMRCALFAILLIAACDTPDLKIVYRVANGSTGATCGNEVSCGDVEMSCPSVLFLRVLRPSQPNSPLVTVCDDIRTNGTHDMCAIGNVDLSPTVLPRETLEVQVSVWPREMVTDEETGELDCGLVAASLQFDATSGFPVAGPINPAFGGRGFYNPGDDETFVTLGCTDPLSVNSPSCAATGEIEVTSTVGDFENLPFSVSSTIGDRLAVSIGEPKPFDDGAQIRHQLNSANIATLPRTAITPTPAWGGGVNLMFTSSACIQVLEDGAQTTSTLRCKAVSPDETTLDLPGVRLPKSTLDQVLAALSLAKFPDEGLTVGIVLDAVGVPIAGATIDAIGGTIEYLDATRTGLVPNMTSSSGIFVSRDAPYGTIFSTFIIDQTIPAAIGGRVDGKVTVVILQSDNTIGS